MILVVFCYPVCLRVRVHNDLLTEMYTSFHVLSKPDSLLNHWSLSVYDITSAFIIDKHLNRNRSLYFSYVMFLLKLH